MSAGIAIRKESARFGGRQLGDLISIGPAMLRDFELLGIRSVAQLGRQNPQDGWRGSIRIFASWTRFARQWRRRGIRGCRRSNASGGIGAGNARREKNEETG